MIPGTTKPQSQVISKIHIITTDQPPTWISHGASMHPSTHTHTNESNNKTSITKKQKKERTLVKLAPHLPHTLYKISVTRFLIDQEKKAAKKKNSLVGIRMNPGRALMPTQICLSHKLFSTSINLAWPRWRSM